MAKTKPDTILLHGDPNRLQREANEAITPGHLIELRSDDKVQKHSTAEGRHARLVAVENDIVGDGIDHDYKSGEVVQFNAFAPGDRALLILSDGENVVKGDWLGSNGDGTVQQVTPGSTSDPYVIGVALEDIDLTSSSTADPSNRIKALIV